jgi:hypothetical protein
LTENEINDHKGAMYLAATQLLKVLTDLALDTRALLEEERAEKKDRGRRGPRGEWP